MAGYYYFFPEYRPHKGSTWAQYYSPVIYNTTKSLDSYIGSSIYNTLNKCLLNEQMNELTLKHATSSLCSPVRWILLIWFPCFFVVQLLSHFWLFVTPRTAARQASLSFTSPGTCSNSCPLTWWYHPTMLRDEIMEVSRQEEDNLP